MKGNGSLMMKIWKYDFNAMIKGIKLRHLWVLLPVLPFVLWNKEALVVVRNHLDRFPHLEENILFGVEKKVGMILEEIDMSK